MTKTRSTKSALVSSVVAMFLCFTMLMGTTFAWFTDSVTSSGNVIETGTLKVDLEVLGTDNTTWTSVKDTNDSIFNYTNWEPGFVQTKILRVENEGSLALKWKARLESETALSALAGVIDVYVLAWGVLEDTSAVVYPANRDLDGFTKVGTLTDFINTVETTTTGVLEAGEKAYLAIAFKMQDTAGNEYQDMTLGEYDLKILATQFTSEDDSFDNQYDADLEIGENGVSRILEDGSTAFFYNEESGFGGKVKLIALPDDVGSEYTVNSVVNDLGGALAGVTLDKLTIHSGVENAYKSLDGSLSYKNIVQKIH